MDRDVADLPKFEIDDRGELHADVDVCFRWWSAESSHSAFGQFEPLAALPDPLRSRCSMLRPGPVLWSASELRLLTLAQCLSRTAGASHLLPNVVEGCRSGARSQVKQPANAL